MRREISTDFAAAHSMGLSPVWAICARMLELQQILVAQGVLDHRYLALATVSLGCIPSHMYNGVPSSSRSVIEIPSPNSAGTIRSHRRISNRLVSGPWILHRDPQSHNISRD
jgi:hypothetical protein